MVQKKRRHPVEHVRKIGSSQAPDVASPESDAPRGQRPGHRTSHTEAGRARRTQRSPAESEERVGLLLLGGVQDYAIYMLSPEGMVVTWNTGAEHLKGYSRDEILGQHFSRFYTEEDIRNGRPRRLLEDAIAQGRSEDEGWRVRKDGSRFWANVVATAVRDRAGRLKGFAKVTRDITERKRAEEAVRRSEALYRTIAQHLPDGSVVVIDDHLRFQVAEGSLLGALGLPMGRIEGRPVWEVLKDSAANQHFVERVQRTLNGELGSEELEVAGRAIWMRHVPIRAESGGVIAAMSLALDVTEVKQTEASLRASERRLGLALDAAHAAAWELNLATGEYLVTDRLLNLLCVPKDVPPSVVENWLEFVVLEDRKRVEAEFAAACAEGGPPFESEFRVRRMDGALRWFASHGRQARASGGALRIVGVVQDTTEYKAAAAEIRSLTERERFLADVVENTITPFGVGTADGRISIFNRAFAELLGYTRQELEQREPTWTADLTPPEWRERESANLVIAARDHKAVRYEKEYRRKDGSTVPVELFVQPIFHDDGTLAHYRAFINDITERKRAEAALRESEAKLRGAFANAAIGFALGAPGGQIVEANPAFCRLIGYTIEELRERTYLDLIHPDDRAETIRLVTLMIAGQITHFVHESRYVCKHQRSVWVRKSVALVRDAVGTPRWIFALSEDITERRLAQEQLERSRQGLSRLVEVSRSVIAKADRESMLQAVSEAALTLTNARMATCGHSYLNGEFLVSGSARVPGAPACPPGRMFEPRLGGVHTLLMEGAESIRLNDQDLKTHARWWGLPEGHVPMNGLLGAQMRGPEGQANGIILVTDKLNGDFTEEDESLLKQLATTSSLALQHVEARASLEQADARKNQFLAMLSHELRNPLAPIRNSLYVLDRAAPGGEQARRALLVIDRQLAHMTRLVEDLLDVTRISRGKIQLQREPMDLTDVTRRAIEDHRGAFVANRLELTVSIPERPMRIVGDRTRIAQVIGNLLHNALKFTEAGGNVVVSLEARESASQAVIRVSDTGVGIPPEVLPTVFEAFTQADTTLDRSKGGIGLGLSLVKGIVEMHGGTAIAESEGVGKGAHFTITLPLLLEAASEPEPAREGRDRPGALRVLVIEDNPDAAESLREVLELEGHTVDVALSGPAGIDEAHRFAPDVALCDIGLPGMDGYEVAKAMRADPELRGITLVALTGYAGAEDVSKSMSAGFDHHLAKPPNLERLEGVLAQAAHGSP